MIELERPMMVKSAFTFLMMEYKKTKISPNYNRVLIALCQINQFMMKFRLEVIMRCTIHIDKTPCKVVKIPILLVESYDLTIL
jgi:hypothetical protein